MENITLKIKGSQFVFGNTDKLDMTVIAHMQRKKDKYIINYLDHDLNEVEVTVKNNAVILNRLDEEEQIIFEKAMPYTISYNTKYGSIGLNMYTTMVETDICCDSGKIEIEYLIDLMGEQAVNKLYMSYHTENVIQEDIL